MPKVLNYKPKHPGTPRIAIVGDCPGPHEEEAGRPFAGTSGNVLRSTLSQCGINLDNCFLGHVCQLRPPNNDLSKFSWSGPEIQTGIQLLHHELTLYAPDVIICCGAAAVRSLNGGVDVPILRYRGSPFYSTVTASWCVGTLHPSFLIRAITQTYLFLFDVKKALRISRTKQYSLPNRRIYHAPTADDCVQFLSSLRQVQAPVAFDLEGGVEAAGIKCVSFCNTPDEILTVPFRNGARFIDGNYFSDPRDEARVWRAVCELLSDPAVPKLAHNCYYEHFCFLWNHGIVIRNLRDDTMFMHWELLCETDKDLGTLASIYTDEPYYKADRTIDNDDEHRIYCAKDSAVTLEAYQQLKPLLQAHQPSWDHYRFNMRVVLPYFYMAVRGCKIDRNEWKRQTAETYSKIIDQQRKVNKIVGATFNPKSTAHKLAYLYGHIGPPPKKITDAYRHAAYLATLSPKFKPKKKRTPKGSVLTADETALDQLYIETGNESLLEILRLIQLRTRFSDLQKVVPFEDGRIRCSFANVGPDTGRSSSSETVVMTKKDSASLSLQLDGAVKLTVKPKKFYLGTNLQNQTKTVRRMFVADQGYDFFQYDLAGADAWTVAADLKAVGHPEMFDHLKNKIKPSRNIVLALRYGLGAVKDWTTEDWKKRQSEVDSDGVDAVMYLCSKRVQHGTNYGMEVPLLRKIILKDSIKGILTSGSGEPINLNNATGEKLQQLYTKLYNVNARRRWLIDKLSRTGRLDAANGHRRKFLNIRSRSRIEGEVARAALSHEPQANTTYVTNLATCNMFYDPDNRRPNGSLVVEPLLTVHDAVCGQWPEESRTWALNKLREWFDIEITIHGIPVAIPADGGWGKNWKDLPNEI